MASIFEYRLDAGWKIFIQTLDLPLSGKHKENGYRDWNTALLPNSVKLTKAYPQLMRIFGAEFQLFCRLVTV